MASSSDHSNYLGDAPTKPAHKHTSRDSKKTQAKRRQSMFEIAPESSAYYVSGQTTSIQHNKSQHKKSMKGKIGNFDRQFGSKS